MRESIDHGDREHDLGAVVSLLEILADLDSVDEESAPLPDGGLAQARTAAAQLFGGSEPAGEADAAPAVLSMDFEQIEAWLAESEPQAAATRGAVTARTLDRHEPGLTAYGYDPDVEIDADIDADTATATITVVMRPADDTATPLALTVTNPAGVIRRGTVNTYGLAVVKDVPISQASPNDLTFQWSVTT